MDIPVQFYSYLKELAGTSGFVAHVKAGARLGDLLQEVAARYPRVGGMQGSILAAVDVDYQDRAYRLKRGDVVSLFPPVQGG
jgi:molybdopterin converting factor small subunit